MLRSDAESSSLKTYLPAGKILPPGISTGWLNVTIVFLSRSSAITLSRSAGATRDEQRIIATTVNRFIFDDTQESENDGSAARPALCTKYGGASTYGSVQNCSEQSPSRPCR